jgi:hypothetical protein
MAPISLNDLRRMSDALAALRGQSITGAAMRSDLRQIRLEMADGTLAVIRLDTDEAGKGRFEVGVIRPPAPPSSQLEVRVESA